MGVACFWCGFGDNQYSILLSGRAFLGIFEAPIESIMPSTITDIFFLHERGEKISIYGLSVLGGNELGPMLSAFIIQNLNMRWAFFIVGIIILVAEIPIFFFMPETKFIGERVPIEVEDEQELDELGKDVSRINEIENAKRQSGSVATPRLKTYRESLKPWGQNDPSVSLKNAFLRPFVLLAYPTVIWSCIIYGFALSWNVIIGASLAQIFSPP